MKKKKGEKRRKKEKKILVEGNEKKKESQRKSFEDCKSVWLQIMICKIKMFSHERYQFW